MGSRGGGEGGGAVYHAGFRVEGLGLRVSGLGLRVEGLGYHGLRRDRVSSLRCKRL